MGQNKKPLKQMAGIPIRSFDPKNIESDLDTVRTELVREKIKEIKLGKQVEYPTGRFLFQQNLNCTNKILNLI